VGVYFQNIPTDPLTGLASIPYDEAERRGYFKLDFLNLNVYKGVRDEAHLNQLVQSEPMWEMLEDEEVVNELFHLSGHFNIVKTYKPRTIEQLAMVLALIRPGKRHLVGYDWAAVQASIWTNDGTDEYVFKKAHSLSYAHVIVVQMNLLLEQALAEPQTPEVSDEKPLV
jgi:DNA polymerase III alpha subunit